MRGGASRALRRELVCSVGGGSGRRAALLQGWTGFFNGVHFFIWGKRVRLPDVAGSGCRLARAGGIATSGFFPEYQQIALRFVHFC